MTPPSVFLELSTLQPKRSSCCKHKFCSATKSFYKRWLLWVRTWTFPFLGQLVGLCDQTRGRFHFYPVWRSSDGSEEGQTRLEQRSELCKGEMGLCSQSCDAFVMWIDEKQHYFVPLYQQLCLNSLFLQKKQELIPRCWILSLEMGRSGLNDYSNGWVGEQEAGRCEMSGLDTHCLCFNPFKAASFMLPQAAVPFSSSLPFDFGEFGINFTYNSWLLCTWPQ